MNRREFSLQALTAVGAGIALPGLASAQGVPAEGKQYIRLKKPAPVSSDSGKIEVVEFFWYGCGHCNAFEPTFVEWAKSLPADVSLRRVPVGFRPQFTAHQKLFYSLEAMGLVSTLHHKVFDAIHNRGQRLDTPESIQAFVVANRVDGTKFMQMYNSFGIGAKATKAKALAEADGYNIEGVPAIGVAGRYWTSVSHNGNHERTLATANYLIDLARSGR